MGTQLVQEFEHYADAKSSHRAVVNSPETFPPLYHDGRDRWNNTQPWFPLFLEWEAEYFHVPYDQWDMEDISTHAAKDKKFSYTVKQDDGPLWEKDNNDKRTVSGRILLLPQPVFSLHAQVERLFSTVPAEVLNPILDSDQRAQLLKDIQKLPFISAPLGGFTDHLVTVVDGSHVKPTVRYPGKLPEPLTEAASESHLVGLDIDALRKIGVENDLTPYGSLVRLGDLQHPAFKPVTHGQFRLIKLNIIDKFGQAVAAIDPTRRVEGPPPLYPHIGEYYRPQAYQNTKIPNVVIQPEEPEKCPFIQIPPNINQPARLHMNWVQLEEYNKTYEWRPITEWENPIWGWVVVNYVNYGVQFFLRDGTFYREVRVASPNNPNPGAVASDKWLPFQPPKEDPKRQLDQLIKKFTDDQNYLLGFMEMINTAVENARSVPGAYSQCVNSLIGRPLALVNAGFSLELAENARTNQSTVGNQQGMLPPISLLPDYRIPQYDFAIKLGDSVRPHDGLVGFFKAKDKPQPTDELDLTDVYTPFPNDTKQIHPIDSQGGGFLRLKPFWLNPGDYTDKSLGNPSETYNRDRNRHLTVCGLLVDPFTPVNAYSSILPVEPLALSPWTWESALLKMTAFFHFGPLVVEDDVPELNPKKVLTANYNLENDTVKEKIKLPALAAAEWSWLQPYINTETEVTEQDETEAEGKEVYMALSLGKIDPVPQFSPGPLTAVEGYLQMKRPITGPDSK
ncbi:hypothetical protein BGW36DRAFT_389837 [Talaromyces proteolyticus]|uniref:Uncharacterized protein n=1 Tax=Talaromyces proteolyticus TaxID=1131652 RepID=A0AAD4KE90_9EURO|nr:uncharacterized protein BGW36DRAFT_389837 [Talaromyces proteolyticus]KAH8689865.1 hypothetical protein BGW36DRAFT_389837 [Talaromyces proteolyticus]